MCLYQYKQTQFHISLSGHLPHWFHSKQHKEISPSTLTQKSQEKLKPKTHYDQQVNNIFFSFSIMLNSLIKTIR